MKFLRIVSLLIFLLALLPFGAFCDETHHDDTADHGHCVLMCHAVCFHATAVNPKIVFIPAAPVESLALSALHLSYQNPSLDPLKRPPAVSA